MKTKRFLHAAAIVMALFVTVISILAFVANTESYVSSDLGI